MLTAGLSLVLTGTVLPVVQLNKTLPKRKIKSTLLYQKLRKTSQRFRCGCFRHDNLLVHSQKLGTFSFHSMVCGCSTNITLFDFCHSCALLHLAVASDDFCIAFGGGIRGTGHAYSSMKLGSCKFARADKFPEK